MTSSDWDLLLYCLGRYKLFCWTGTRPYANTSGFPLSGSPQTLSGTHTLMRFSFCFNVKKASHQGNSRMFPQCCPTTHTPRSQASPILKPFLCHIPNARDRGDGERTGASLPLWSSVICARKLMLAIKHQPYLCIRGKWQLFHIRRTRQSRGRRRQSRAQGEKFYFVAG